MAVGKNNAVNFFFFLLMGLCVVSTMGAVYNVGDSTGWTTIGHYDYMKWAASKTFYVGDIIVFNYHPERHNVQQVKHAAFNSCNNTAPIVTYTSGNDSITIKRSGHLYYLCGIPGHCLAGQKVDIRVSNTSGPMSSPSPTGAPSGSMLPPPTAAPQPSPSGSSSLIHSSMKLFWAMLVLAFCIGGLAY